MILSEKFIGIQGEGKYTGVPAVFLRASQCNLRCNGKWKCDTWDLLGTGKEYSAEEIISWLRENKIEDRVRDASTHIVLTGGEPFIEQQALDFANFIQDIGSAFVEVETNGTVTNTKLFCLVDHITCSPKMASSGNPYNKRYNPSVIKRIMSHRSYCFKFVIEDEADFAEAYGLITELGIPKENVYLMPAGDTREKVISRLPLVWHYAEHFGYRVSTRLHVIAFDNKKGI